MLSYNDYVTRSADLDKKLSERQSDIDRLDREIARKDQAKLQFVASASHDLRTPVAGMMGLLSLLQSTPLNSEQASLVSSLTSCCHSLLVGVDDVIDMAKIEAGQLEVRQLPFNLAEQVDCTLEPLRSLAIDKSITLVVNVADDAPEFVVGDPCRLRQLLNNLVGNAIKFTSGGTVEVKVEVPSSGGIRFEVTDTGIGISARDVDRLFEAHFQADSRDARSLGSGLGLTITARIVEIMGGRVGVESHLGEGSVFWIELPLPTATGELPSTEASFPQAEAFRKLRLLVAEDNPIVSRVLKAQLSHLGHDVTLVPNGKEAIDACSVSGFDAIIMDCQMPHIDGYDATRAIRLLAGYGKVPVLALTAQAFTGEKEKCLAAGMSDYLIKPVTPSELQERLNFHTREDGYESEDLTLYKESA